MLGAWINLKERKLTSLPADLLAFSENFPKSENYKIITMEDTRANGKKPKNLV